MKPRERALQYFLLFSYMCWMFGETFPERLTKGCFSLSVPFFSCSEANVCRLGKPICTHAQFLLSKGTNCTSIMYWYCNLLNIFCGLSWVFLKWILTAYWMACSSSSLNYAFASAWRRTWRPSDTSITPSILQPCRCICPTEGWSRIR